MNAIIPKQNIQTRILLALAISVTLFVSPWNSIDPVNLPKIVPLGILGLALFFSCFSNLKAFMDKDFRYFYLINGMFLFQMIVVFMLDKSEFSFKFYGAPGRNTGFLSYMLLILICMSASRVSFPESSKKVILVLFGLVSLLSIYGLAQWRKLDFFDYSNAYNSDVFGTFGNPNFQSAFMGIGISPLLIWALFASKDLKVRIGLGICALLCTLNVKLSSDQGFVSAFAGVTTGVILYLFAQKKILQGKILLSLTFASGVSFIIGLFGSGPLSSLIYNSSIQARGFYWQAAIRMMFDNPISGVGFDGFGDNYRRYRPISYQEQKFFTTADSAHSVPLDIGSGGGIPLFFLHIIIICFTLLSIIKFMKRSQKFDPVHGALSAAWVAYQIQSFLSINQLGLAIWGYVLTGLIIGYEINTRPYRQSVQKTKPNLNKSKKLNLLAISLGGALGALLVLPPYLAANNYYKALESGIVESLDMTTYAKPYDRNRFLYTAQILASNKMENRAIQILDDASKLYPNNYEVWLQWSRIISAPEVEKAKAEAEMKRLETL
jgi:O-antigen ligase